MMTWRFLTRKFATLAALLVVAVLGMPGRQARGASAMLPNGEPDAKCSDLRLWLRADSGIQDAEGLSPADADFSGTVSAWNDRSACKFDIAAAPGRAPAYVPLDAGAGGRPSVAFSGRDVLSRVKAALHDRPTSTTILVLKAKPNPFGNISAFCAGRNPGTRELLSLAYSGGPDPALSTFTWNFPAAAGERSLGIVPNLPPDGPFSGRFAVVMFRNDGRPSIEYHDAMGGLLSAPREVAPVDTRAELNKCGPEFHLGGENSDLGGSFVGQIAEMIVYNRGLSSVESHEMLAYLNRRYQLDAAKSLFPADTYLLQAEAFDGVWQILGEPRSMGGRCAVSTEEQPAPDGIKTTIHLARKGAYHVWVRGVEGGLETSPPNKKTAMRTIVQGKEMIPNHALGPGGLCWRKAGTVELQAGVAEVVVRGEGPGRKTCDAVLISPTVDTPEVREEMFAFAQRLRGVGGSSQVTALFDNGLRLDGGPVTGWRWTNSAGQAARPESAALPGLYCINFDSRPEPPTSNGEALFELHNGDRLRGMITDYTPGSYQGDREVVPPRLKVRPVAGLPPLSVDLTWIRRITFESSSRKRCPPQTLVCRNGRTYAFKAIRWGEFAVSLLTEDGVERIALSDVIELSLPAVDAWEMFYREMTVLDPEGRAEILRLDTMDGLSLTTSTVTAAPVIGREEAFTSCRLFRPVWCNAPISLPWANTRRIWRAPAHLVPLSRFLPEEVRQGGTLGNSWRWQLDRNVAGGSLRSDGAAYLWGFGVHAPNEMIFPLADSVKALRSSVGIDSAVGKAGCVITKVYLDRAADKPLFESPRLVGGSAAISTGEVALPAVSGGKRRLVLATESDGDLRPEKGAALDIGDHVDWLEPVLLLDPAKLRAEVAKRRPAEAQ